MLRHFGSKTEAFASKLQASDTLVLCSQSQVVASPMRRFPRGRSTVFWPSGWTAAILTTSGGTSISWRLRLQRRRLLRYHLYFSFTLQCYTSYFPNASISFIEASVLAELWDLCSELAKAATNGMIKPTVFT